MHPFLKMRRPARHIEGAGAEQDQQAHAHANALVALAGDPKAERRHGRGVRLLRGYVASPQPFPAHPLIRQVVDEDAAAVGQYAQPHLPGRVPPAGWDGEPGAASPLAGTM